VTSELAQASNALDTVDRAAATPDHPQPFRELGLKDDEYQRVRDILGRRPTDAELAMYSVMWSEHCSYKSSKVHLRYFGETTTEKMREAMLAGIGENAGVVDIGDGWAATFKVESHNHPSYIEPYQGAATGVGGIVRDIMAMGARPVAVMDQLRFGAADAPDTRRVVDGVVRGIGGYGNSLGLPNIGGETVFDASYAGNPLVNALCVGVLRKEDLHLAFASGTGNKIILFGARTGLDGIGGVSVLASETFGGDEGASGSRKKLPSVQVGDPFMEKVLIECCLELYANDLVIGIQDLGGAGLSCATSELASAGDGGMRIELDTAPLRAANMTPAEILSSESQERMCAVVSPDNVGAFMAVCRKWDVLATVIGEVTDGDRLEITWHGETVVDVPPRTVAHEGPVYERPVQRPDSQDALNADTSAKLPRPSTGDELRATLLALLGSPHLCSRAFITEQYDRYVRGNTVLAENADGGVLRVDEDTGESGKLRRRLKHGRIIHGVQFGDPELARIPTTYYGEGSAIDLAIRHHPRRRAGQPMRFGFVGLGAGTLASYAAAGDTVRFYEINPDVVALSAGPAAVFTYVRDSRGAVEVALGDARIVLERETPQRFQVLALDAFSSDSIPAHLLTVEAGREYMRHLSEDGILAIHISNRYLDLEPVVRGLADALDLAVVLIDNDRTSDMVWSSTWMLLARDEATLAAPEIQSAASKGATPTGPVLLWTDTYSNLLDVFKG